MESASFSAKNGVWTLPLEAVVELFETISASYVTSVSEGVQRLLKEGLEKRKTYRELLDKWNKGEEIYKEVPFLYRHQALTVEVAKVYDKFLFGLDTGVGKTLIGLTIIKANPKIKWCVIPPKSTIVAAWLNDAREFFPELKLCPLSQNFDSKAKITDLLDSWGAEYNPRRKKEELQKLAIDMADVLVVNSESFNSKKAVLRGKGTSGVIFDESVKLKSPSASITKDITDYSQTLKKLYLLSGKPAPNGEEDYFTQVRMVDPSLFGTRLTRFRERYFMPKDMFSFIMRPDMKDRFAERLAQKAIFISKQECLDLPPEIFEVMSLPFEAKDEQLYRQMVRDFMLEIGGSKFTAINSGVLRNKLRQLTSGFAYTEDGIHPMNNLKLSMLGDYNEALGGSPYIVWCAYREDIHRVKAYLEKQGVSCTTAFSETKDLDQSIKDFMDNKAQVMIAHPASVKYGITFCGRNMKVNCTNALYYSYTENFDDFYQSKDRIYRNGQTEKVTYTFLMVDKTVDALTYASLKRKGDSASFMEELTKHAQEVFF